MNSLRLQTIASFIDKDDRVVDVGCDHAYLSIYLFKRKACQKVIATDINPNALEAAKKNIQKNHLTKKICTILSDGLKKVDQNEINTVVIAGMGASTILHIIEEIDQKRIKKLVLQSNNDLYLLRNSLEKIGYYLTKEKVIFEKGHYYVVGVYTLHFKHLNLREKYFGLFDSSCVEYYQYLNKELHLIFKKLNFKHGKEKIKVLLKILLLKKYL